MSSQMEHIDVRSYHCAAPPESTADMTSSRQRLIDSVIRQKHSSDYRPNTSTIRRESSRPTVPNLYANQRVRQRSISKEPPVLRRDLKKAVAFGTTITIKDGKSPIQTRPSSSIGSQSNSRLYDEIYQLRSRLESSEKMRKDVDQLQKIVKSLIEENVNLSTNLKQLDSIIHDLHESNSALKTRVNLLELWYARSNTDEMPSNRLHNNNFSHLNGKSKKQDSETFHLTYQNNARKPRQNEYGVEMSRRLAHIYIGDEYSTRHSRSTKHSDEMDDESNRTSD